MAVRAMVVANFRFYEELNDFLPAPDRKCVFASVCANGATVKQAIEALGVPHTKVEVILANGESSTSPMWFRRVIASACYRCSSRSTLHRC